MNDLQLDGRETRRPTLWEPSPQTKNKNKAEENQRTTKGKPKQRKRKTKRNKTTLHPNHIRSDHWSRLGPRRGSWTSWKTRRTDAGIWVTAPGLLAGRAPFRRQVPDRAERLRMNYSYREGIQNRKSMYYSSKRAVRRRRPPSTDAGRHAARARPDRPADGRLPGGRGRELRVPLN